VAFEQGCDGVVVDLAKFLDLTSLLKHALDFTKEREAFSFLMDRNRTLVARR